MPITKDSAIRITCDNCGDELEIVGVVTDQQVQQAKDFFLAYGFVKSPNWDHWYCPICAQRMMEIDL